MIEFIIQRWKALLLAAAAVFAYLWFSVWPAGVQVAARQADLIGALSRRDTSDFSRLLAEDYRDRWGFDARDAAQAFRDFTRQFDALSVEYTGGESSIDPGAAIVTAHIKIGGSGGPFADTIVSRANRLDAPFTFEWRKASWTPWSWRLYSIDHPELEVPDGYVPGDWGATITNQF